MKALVDTALTTARRELAGSKRMKLVDLAVSYQIDPSSTSATDYAIRNGFSKNSVTNYMYQSGEYTELGLKSLEANYGTTPWKLDSDFPASGEAPHSSLPHQRERRADAGN